MESILDTQQHHDCDRKSPSQHERRAKNSRNLAILSCTGPAHAGRSSG